MVSPQQGLKGLAGLIGFFFGALLLSALVSADPVAAQCGPAPGAANTAYGDWGTCDQYHGMSGQCVWSQRPLHQQRGQL
jgi:invasion protein IalB